MREIFGLKNLKVMFPFCRTPEEGRRVPRVLEGGGLARGEDGLEVSVMAEIPSNVILAKGLAEILDGFSISSNDLTQLVLGVDWDSERVANFESEGFDRDSLALPERTAPSSGRTRGKRSAGVSNSQLEPRDRLSGLFVVTSLCVLP